MLALVTSFSHFLAKDEALLLSDTSSLSFIKDQWWRTVVDVGVAVNTVVVFVAHIWIFMVEETISSVTASIKTRFWFLDILSSSTINIEGVVAKLIIGVGCLEQQSIRTELFLWNLPDTFIVFITLFRIREEAVGFRTQKLSL